MPLFDYNNVEGENLGAGLPTYDTSSLNQPTNTFTPSPENLQNPFSGPAPSLAPGSQQAASAPRNILTGNGPISLTYNPKLLEPTSGFSSGIIVKQHFNQWEHNVEMYLDNSGNFDGSRRYPINPAAVINLSITDTLNNWVVDGSMLLMYLPEGSPTSKKDNAGNPSKTQIKGARDTGALLSQYEFRGDGYDLLRIMIQPVPTNPSKNAEFKRTAPVDIKANDPLWTLSYLFSVYDIEDLSEVPGIVGQASSYLRCLRLKFRDVRYEILKTTNLEYSTATTKDYKQYLSFGSPEPLANGMDGERNPRALKTGLAILDIWNNALARPDEGTKTGSLEFLQQLSPDWNAGSSEIFYTSPAQYSAADDIEYIFSQHIGPPLEGDPNLNDVCFMHTKRPSTGQLLEEVCITPLTNFFKDSTDLQLERFTITNHTDEELDPGSLIQKAPNNSKSLTTFKYGQIIAYSLMDMSPEINSTTFTTTPVYSIDIGKRQFNIEFKGNDLITTRKLIASEYIKNVFKGSSDNEKLFLPTLHKTKEKTNLFPTFSLNGDNKLVRQKNGFHKLLYTGLFQNACICFKTFGLTLRESGSFIAIDGASGSKNTDYANKLCGQWFVVQVDHIFEAGSYMNVIYAVKVHRHNERQASFDLTI